MPIHTNIEGSTKVIRQINSIVKMKDKYIETSNL